MFILKRSTLERINKTCKVCGSGFRWHAKRAKEQEGVDFGNGVVGNGVDTYYPDGLNDAEYLRIAEYDPLTAAWLITNRGLLGEGAERPSKEVFQEVMTKVRQSRGGSSV